MTFEDLYIKSIRINIPNEQDSYVFQLPVIRNFNTLELKKSVTFLVGENGTGKSTLLESIAVCCGFNPEGGTKNFSFASNETHSPLWKCMHISKGFQRPKDGFFLRAESFYNVATEIERLAKIPVFSGGNLYDSYGGKSLHEQSHGESFLSLVLNRFGGNGLYLLDEPEAALSPQRQFSLIAKLAELVKDDSQFIIATHSPILLAFPDADIYVLGEDGMQLTQYEQTEHYTLTKMFLDNPGRMIKYLCE